MEIICKSNLCTGCAVCAEKCSRNAITMQENEEGFLYPQIIIDRCINCGICIKICPSNQNTIKLSTSNKEPEFLAGYHLNREVQIQSSSGGAFSAIAEIVLSEKGTVFGAVMDPKNNQIYHKMASSEKDLREMRLSKYYQSKTEEIYSQVKKQLESGRKVLFTGTACQIAGLQAYLGNMSKENLITMDVLCHGVASKKVIDSYLHSQEIKNRDKVRNFYFRTKELPYGWQGGNSSRMKILFKGGNWFLAERHYDTYFLGFNHNFFLRECCYSCQYCGLARISDFTVADYWGCPEDTFSKDEIRAGISLLLVNTEKAKTLLPSLNEKMHLIPANKEVAINHNKALSSPQTRPKVRDYFFPMMERYGYDRTIERLFRKRFIKYKVKIFIKKVLPAEITRRILKNV